MDSITKGLKVAHQNIQTIFSKNYLQEKQFQNSPQSSSTTDFPTILSNFQDEIIEEFSQTNEGSQQISPKKSLHSQQNIVESPSNGQQRASLHTKIREFSSNNNNNQKRAALCSYSQPQINFQLSKPFEDPFIDQWSSMLFFNENKEKLEEVKMEELNLQNQLNNQQKLIIAKDIIDDGEEAVRQQILSLDLEESAEESKKLSIVKKTTKPALSKKKLNLNSQEFYQFQQPTQQTPQKFNQPIINQDKTFYEPQLVSLSCSQFKELYLSESQIQTNSLMKQYQQAQYYKQDPLTDQNQQLFQKTCQFKIDSPITPLTPLTPLAPLAPTQPINDNSQIIVQTTHNPFILEISAKRHTGFLKYFDPVKQYGFIVVDDENREIFFHFQDVTHYLLTKEFLSSFREGRIIQLSFNICLYRGKASVRRKAVNLQPL